MQQDSGFREYNITLLTVTKPCFFKCYDVQVYVTFRTESEKTCNPTRKVLRNFKGEPWTVDNIRSKKQPMIQRSS